jgi:hypothetical protein
VATPTAQLQATNEIWATTVLVDAGLPPTPNNIDNVMSWMTMENPASNWYNRNNPLNASLGTNASDGTGTYPSLTVGAENTAAMLRQSNMSPIYNALAAGASPAQFLAALQQSPWASSHYPQYTTLPSTPAVVAFSGQTLQASPGTPSDANPTGALSSSCNGGSGLDIFGAHIGDGCQLKALAGGLLIGLGGGVMLVGAVLIAAYGLSHTGVGKAVAGVATSTPVGKAAGAVKKGAGSITPQARQDRYSERQAASQEPASVRTARYRSQQVSHPGPRNPDRTLEARRQQRSAAALAAQPEASGF